MKPIIFGEGGHQLYGVYHPSAGPKRRNSAVLLCYPHVTEYNFVHRAYRQIALMLSQDGFDVFRFDYYGTGDSAGDVRELGIDQWVKDVAVAAEELRDLSRVSELSLVGRQLGATIAMRAVARGLGVKRIVLWEPILDGERFIANLEQSHRDACLARLQPVSDGTVPWNALLGFPFPLHLRREIEQIRTIDELPERVRVALLMVPPNDPSGVYANMQRWASARAPCAHLIEMVGEPTFELGSVREGIVSAGTVPSRIVELMTRSWECVG